MEFLKYKSKAWSGNGVTVWPVKLMLAAHTGGRWAKCRCFCNGRTPPHPLTCLRWPPSPPTLTPRGRHYLTLVNSSQNRVIDLLQIFWLSRGRFSWVGVPITLISKKPLSSPIHPSLFDLKTVIKRLEIWAELGLYRREILRRFNKGLSMHCVALLQYFRAF